MFRSKKIKLLRSQYAAASEALYDLQVEHRHLQGQYFKLKNFENRSLLEDLLNAEDRANKAEQALISARNAFVGFYQRQARDIFG